MSLRLGLAAAASLGASDPAPIAAFPGQRDDNLNLKLRLGTQAQLNLRVRFGYRKHEPEARITGKIVGHRYHNCSRQGATQAAAQEPRHSRRGVRLGLGPGVGLNTSHGRAPAVLHRRFINHACSGTESHSKPRTSLQTVNTQPVAEKCNARAQAGSDDIHHPT